MTDIKSVESKEIVLTKEETKAIAFSMKDIENADDMSEAVRVLSILNKKADALEADKQELTKPINDVLKRIRAKYKPFEEKLEDAIGLIRTKMSKYQTTQKKLAEAKEDKIISRIGEGKGKLKPETAMAKLEDVAKPENKVSTDEGMVKFKTVKKFIVVDVTKLPKEFILPNEVAIRKAMNEGKELAGVEYSTEEVPVNSR